VSNKFLSVFTMDASAETKTQLEQHMGKVHQMVIEVSEAYYGRMRRHVYVTPKSYLSFIELYKKVYKDKYDGIDILESNIIKGLEKLLEAASVIEIMKIELKKEELKLNEAKEETNTVLVDLDIKGKAAKEKSDEVNILKKNCTEQLVQISSEKDEADKDLAVAMPFLNKAIAAADSIHAKDIKEMSSVRTPSETTRVIMDTMHVLF
jgi:dynein heavy chain